MKNKKPYLSIIIPAYNEEHNLKKGVLDEVFNYLKSVTYTYEVLFIDDGSQDKTVYFIEQFIKNKRGFFLIQNSHGGKAITVMTGLLAAKGEIALFTDMDQATPLEEVEKFIPKFKEGYDVVIGSRSGRKGAPIVRKIMAWGFITLRNAILGLPFKDTQCGFKAFNEKSRNAIFPQILEEREKEQTHGYTVNAGFDVETLFIAKKKGFKIGEVNVQWHYVGTHRYEEIKNSIEALKDMLRIRWNDLMGKY